jgi:hypothetical protein
MAHARPFWTCTLQDFSNGIKNVSMWGVLTPAIALWVFESPGGLPSPIFESVSGDLTPPSKWGCDNIILNFRLWVHHSPTRNSSIPPIPQVLQVKEHAPIFFFFCYFILEPTFGSFEKFGGVSEPNNLAFDTHIKLWCFWFLLFTNHAWTSIKFKYKSTIFIIRVPKWHDQSNPNLPFCFKKLAIYSQFKSIV